jgi:hypothetical protein
LELLLAAFVDRGEIECGLELLFERSHLSAADDDAGNGLADVNEKFVFPRLCLDEATRVTLWRETTL